MVLLPLLALQRLLTALARSAVLPVLWLQPFIDEGAAPPRRTGLLGVIQRHREEKAARRDAGLQMVSRFCESHAFAPPGHEKYSDRKLNYENLQDPLKEAFLKGGRKNASLIATIAAVPAEITPENARSDKERALAQNALKAAEKLMSRLPNKLHIHNWGGQFGDLHTPRMTICSWTRKLTELDDCNNSKKINSPDQITPQMVRDLF